MVKNMSGTKLSICISTFNRAKFIVETLDSIMPQMTNEVELVVVNSGSTDNTNEILQTYQKEYPQLTYYQFQDNFGIDRNYCRVVNLAQGEYCWLMSDDDLLKPGAIQAVLEAARHNYGLIIVNSEVRTIDFSNVIEPKRLKMDADRTYSPEQFNEFFGDTASYMTFIGCVVIKRQIWLERDKESYFGTDFIHIGVIYQYPLNESCLVIAYPWITIRANNASWTSRYFEIWMFKWPKLVWSFLHIPDIAKNQVCPKEPWRIWKIWLILRAKGAYSTKEYDRWLGSLLENKLRRVFAYLVTLLPGILVNFVVLNYFLLLRPQEFYPIAEIKASPFYYKNYFGRVFKT